MRVISVFEPLSLLTRLYDGSVDMLIYDGLEQAMYERARAAVEKATAKLFADTDGRIRNVTMAVLVGVPKRAILEEAERFGADVIVVGSHGHGMLERFLLGSVSQAVALHATCSVEIVRSPKTLTSERKQQ